MVHIIIQKSVYGSILDVIQIGLIMEDPPVDFFKRSQT